MKRITSRSPAVSMSPPRQVLAIAEVDRPDRDHRLGLARQVLADQHENLLRLVEHLASFGPLLQLLTRFPHDPRAKLLECIIDAAVGSPLRKLEELDQGGARLGSWRKPCVRLFKPRVGLSIDLPFLLLQRIDLATKFPQSVQLGAGLCRRATAACVFPGIDHSAQLCRGFLDYRPPVNVYELYVALVPFLVGHVQQRSHVLHGDRRRWFMFLPASRLLALL